MKNSFLKFTFLFALVTGALISCKSKTEDVANAETAPITNETVNLLVDFKESGIKIQPTMYGIFFEDINFAADGGLYAEMIKNRSFEFLLPKMGWKEPNSNKHSHNYESGILNPVQYSGENANHRYARIEIKGSKYELINEGYRGMGIKKDAKYNLTISTKKVMGDIQKIKFQFIDEGGNILGETFIIP